MQGVFQEERSAEFLAFLQKLSELKAMMYRKLATTVEEDLRSSTLLRELTEKRKTAQDELETLSKNLVNEQKEKERETSALEKILNKLQSELTTLTKSSNQEIQLISNEMSSSMEKSTIDHDTNKANLLVKINALTPQMAKITEDHKQVSRSNQSISMGRHTHVWIRPHSFLVWTGGSFMAKEEEQGRDGISGYHF